MRPTNHESPTCKEEKKAPPPDHVFLGRGLLGVLAKSAQMGYKLGKSKQYRRMGAKGATGHYTRRHAPWEV